MTRQLKLMTVNLVDTFGLVLFIVLYRPRRLPQYFNVFYDDASDSVERVKFNIYRLKLSMESVYERSEVLDGVNRDSYNLPLSDEKISKKEMKQIKENTIVPLIIINPIFKEDNSNNTNNLNNNNSFKHLLDSAMVGLRSNNNY